MESHRLCQACELEWEDCTCTAPAPPPPMLPCTCGHPLFEAMPCPCLDDAYAICRCEGGSWVWYDDARATCPQCLHAMRVEVEDERAYAVDLDPDHECDASCSGAMR